MSPHTAFGFSRFPLDTFVFVGVGSDSMSFPNEPFPYILSVVNYRPNRTPELVITLYNNLNLLTADLPNQRTLHAPSMTEPVAVLVLGNLVPFGRVQSGQPYFLPGYAYPIAVGDIRFADESAGTAFDRIAPPLSATKFRVMSL